MSVGKHPEFRERESSALLCGELCYIPPGHRGQTGPVLQRMLVLRDILQLEVSLVPTAPLDAF